jgi:hypothetical protein
MGISHRLAAITIDAAPGLRLAVYRLRFRASSTRRGTSVLALVAVTRHLWPELGRHT